MRKLFLICLVMSISLSGCDYLKDLVNFPEFGSEYDVVVNRVGYNVNINNMTATVMEVDQSIGDTIITIPGSIQLNGRSFMVTSIGRNSFQGTKMTQVILPQSIEKIGIAAFYKCDRLKKIYLPSGLKKIEQNAFMESGLTELTIPASVAEIEVWSVKGCMALEKITVEDSEEPLSFEIEIYSSSTPENQKRFRELYAGRTIRYIVDVPLMKLTFGEYVQYVGTMNGLYISKPLQIWCYSSTPPSGNLRLSNDAIMESELYVPEGYFDVYEQDSSWGRFWNIYPI